MTRDTTTMTDEQAAAIEPPGESPLVGLRKFGAVVLIELLLAALIAAERILGEAGAAAMVTVALAYLGANVAQKWALK